MIEDYESVIDQWPSVAELATDIDEKPGTVQKWKQRNRIPAEKWSGLLAAARQRDIKIDEATLVRIAGKQAA